MLRGLCRASRNFYIRLDVRRALCHAGATANRMSSRVVAWSCVWTRMLSGFFSRTRDCQAAPCLFWRCLCFGTASDINLSMSQLPLTALNGTSDNGALLKFETRSQTAVSPRSRFQVRVNSTGKPSRWCHSSLDSAESLLSGLGLKVQCVVPNRRACSLRILVSFLPPAKQTSHTDSGLQVQALGLGPFRP